MDLICTSFKNVFLNSVFSYILDLLNNKLRSYIEPIEPHQIETSVIKKFLKVKGISFKPTALESVGLKSPIQLVDAFIKEFYVEITDLFSFTVSIECDEVYILFKTTDTCDRDDYDISYIIRRTEELLETVAVKFLEIRNDADEVVGLRNLIAQKVNNVKERMSFLFKNVIIDVEYLPENAKNGIGVRVEIASLKIHDKRDQKENKSESRKVDIEGVTFFTFEFKADNSQRNSLNQESTLTLNFTSACSLSEQSDSEDSEEKRLEEDRSRKRQLVPFGKFFGMQKIAVCFENEDPSIKVPKMDIAIESIVFMLTPRQVHLLIQLFDTIVNSHESEDENIHQKSMTQSDYKLVQEDLQNQRAAATGLQGKSTWSRPSFEEPISAKVSEVSSSTDANFMSATENLNAEAVMEDEINCKFSCSNLIIVILHEDVLNLSNQNDEVFTVSTVQQLTNIMDSYFSHMEPFLAESKIFTDNLPFVKSCKGDHLRLIAANLKYQNFYEKIRNVASPSHKFSIDNLELLECLNYRCAGGDSVDDIKLLHFEENVEDVCNISLLVNDAVSDNISHTIKKAVLRLSQPTLELDISITQRMAVLLYPIPIFEMNKAQSVYSQELKRSSNTEIDFRIEVDSLNLKLIFPVPDFRPSTDFDKTPWWKRDVRDEYLLIEFLNLVAGTKTSLVNDISNYYVHLHSASVIFCEGKGLENHLIAKVKHKKDDNKEDQLVKIDINIHPPKPIDPEPIYNPKIDIMTQSMHIDVPDDRNMGPFSSKRSYSANSIPVDVDSEAQDTSYEPVLPGDKAEITEFIKSTKSNTVVVINVDLPIVECQLLSKHIYEVIYNRINNDLLTWQSGAVHYPCQTNTASDSDEEDCLSVHSRYNPTKGQMTQQQSLIVMPLEKKQTELCIDLNIGKGLLTLIVPVRDVENKVMPCQNGEFLFFVNNAKVVIVNGYESDKNLGYVVAEVKKVKLYHLDARMTPKEIHAWRNFDCIIPDYLHPTIYKLQDGIKILDPNSRSGGRDMVTVAIKICTSKAATASNKPQYNKMVTVSLGINHVTLNYKMSRVANSWVMQLIDFFNVMDTPIPGLCSGEIVTQMHLHIWNSAIDYRPLKIPTCGFLTVSMATVSSTFSEVSRASVLRLKFDGTNFYLGRQKSSKVKFTKSGHVPKVRLERYISVVDIDFFEINVNTTSKDKFDEMPKRPQYELKIFNNEVNINMCADSTIMLVNFIIYIAECGDIASVKDGLDGDSLSRLKDDDSNLLEDSINEAEKHKKVQEVMAEALNECSITEESLQQSKPNADLFIFNDDSSLMANIETNFPQVQQDLGNIYNRYTQESEDSDDEFFIVEDSDLSNFPRNSKVEMEWVDDGDATINEEHFSTPKGPTNFLRAPPGFPVPISKYTLCNMTIKWKIFGGNDFRPLDKDFIDEKKFYSDCARYSKTSDGIVEIKERNKKEKNSVGYNRLTDVMVELQLLKIQYQYDVYPENTRQASRHAFAVQKVVFLDELQKSSIKTLLYSHVTDKRPQRSQLPMILLRSLYVRPPKNNKNSEECHVNLSVTPIRANIDQDTLMFLFGFVDTLKESTGETSSDSPRHAPPSPSVPILNVNIEEEKKDEEETKKMIQRGLMILLEENEKYEQQIEVQDKILSENQSGLETYFKNVTVSEISIKLDYHGKFNMKELYSKTRAKDIVIRLASGVAQLQSVEFRLPRINYQRGLLGVEKVVCHCYKTWIKDIADNQVSSILRGISYISAVYCILVGVCDLFILPVQQYKKDGRLMWGMQQGASSFSRSTANAFIELALRLVNALKITAEHAYIMVLPYPSLTSRHHQKKLDKTSKNKAYTVREGFSNAVTAISNGLHETAYRVINNTSHEHETKGYTGAVAEVIRLVPSTIINPIASGMEGANQLIEGARFQINPEMQAEDKLKWK